MKSILLYFFGFASGLAALFIYGIVSMAFSVAESGPSGGGIYLESPNKKYVFHATSFSNENSPHMRFRVTDRTKPSHNVISHKQGFSGVYYDFRRLSAKKNIIWSENPVSVKFIGPDNKVWFSSGNLNAIKSYKH